MFWPTTAIPKNIAKKTGTLLFSICLTEKDSVEVEDLATAKEAGEQQFLDRRDAAKVFHSLRSLARRSLVAPSNGEGFTTEVDPPNKKWKCDVFF